MDREASAMNTSGMKNARRLSTLVSAIIVMTCAPALAAGKIFYGSRAGMQVSVVSLSGLDTANAVIRTKHTRKDAIAFCRDYVQKVTRGMHSRDPRKSAQR